LAKLTINFRHRDRVRARRAAASIEGYDAGLRLAGASATLRPPNGVPVERDGIKEPGNG